jgi:hypothetical protein
MEGLKLRGYFEELPTARNRLRDLSEQRQISCKKMMVIQLQVLVDLCPFSKTLPLDQLG